MPPRIPPEKWAEFDALVKDGWDATAASRKVGINPKTGKLRVQGRKMRDASRLARINAEFELPDPVPDQSRLSPEATRALTDFEFFRLRYFGHVSTPWQVDAANRMIVWLESEDKEFAVVNCPPGAGKSTLFTHDIPAWVLVRDRSARVLIGSRTERQARQYVGRLKTTFDRTHPPTASDIDKRKGLAVDAVATLTGDFGRFKPTNPDVWRNEEFTIAQVGDIAGSDKERSVSAYGMDGGFLGGRYDLVIWDDLVDKRSMRTVDAREALINMWETEAETRLEPGGLLILQGQRMRSDDLYRYALDLRAGDPDDFAEDAVRPAKYRHILYRAHDEERCQGGFVRAATPHVDAEGYLVGGGKEIQNPDHAKSGRPWHPDPELSGCLLDPVRLDWRSLRTINANRAERFLVMYQQEDTDPSDALVHPVWVSGGRGDDGVDYPGCWDKFRGLAELPKGLSAPLLSIATADPSPTKFWSVQWWIVHPATEQRFLMDLVRCQMDAPDFLDFDFASQSFVGVMDEWQQRSRRLGAPISHWIVEANAAQRFMLQYDHVRRWTSKNEVRVIPHQTHLNKFDPDFGVQTLGPHYQFGRVRLPGKQRDPGRVASMKLVDEVTRYPHGSYDDCLMAQWFLEANLPKLRDREARVYQLHSVVPTMARVSRGVPA